jgi:arylsulfatase A-like enzyme/pimeloyl-ACP methyl ester carboxylesterase/ABC-type molybdate transport system substrate-binding protein
MRPGSIALLVAVVLPRLAAAQAPGIRVLASNGVRAALEDLRPECESAIGRPLAIEFGTTAALRQRIEAGERFDVAILTSQVVEELGKKGRVAAEPGSELARSGIGVGIRRGASRPDIRTPDALKRTLLAAESVTYAGDGASRVHIERMLEGLGVVDEIGRKTTLEQGSARAMARVAEGRTEVVMTLISEILPTPGIELAGPLPADLQSEVGFRAGVGARSDRADASRALIRCLAGPMAARTFLLRGMEPRSADRFIDVNRLRIHYLDWGSAGKQPLILLHGIGRVAHTFDHVVSHLNERYHVMAVDMRGHGDSGWDPNGAYLVEDYVKDIEGFVEQLGLRNIVLWGNSTGGRVAQVFAGLHPDLVAAVIVEDVGPERPREIATNVTSRIQKEDEAGWANEDELFSELKTNSPRTAEDVLRALAHFGSKQRPDGRTIWKRDPNIAKGFVPTQLWDYVQQIRSPIIYILGGRSTIVPPETQERLRQTLPQVQIVTMPGLGHYPSEEEPDAYLEIVDRFLREGTRSAAARPNIVFVMTDDHAAHAISAYGSRVNETPSLDRLAREGMLFANAFVTNSICSPSRAVILTGLYSHKNGVPVFNRFDGSQVTVAKLLRDAGYHTGIVGKWHLGSDPTGFDRWEILPGQGVYRDPVLYTAASETTHAGYATDVITDLGIDFIRERPKDRPFFLMLHHKAPHREWIPDDEHRRMFETRVIPEPPTLWDDYATRTDALRENEQRVADDLTRRDLKLEPPAGLSAEERNDWLSVKPTELAVVVNGKSLTLTGESLAHYKYQRYMQDYLACVQSVDDNFGRLLDYLKESGLEENTIVIYTSDQGFFLGDHGLYDKRFMYEESLRIPLIVRWPGVVPPGSRADALALNLDFAPTFLEAAGVSVPSAMQGRSLVPLLRGEPPASWRGEFYYRYYHDPGHHNTRAHYGLRTATHKLIHYWTKGQWELFDLRSDPQELRNLYGQPGQEAVTAELEATLARLRRELEDDDRFAHEQPPPGVDGTVAELRGK